MKKNDSEMNETEKSIIYAPYNTPYNSKDEKYS